MTLPAFFTDVGSRPIPLPIICPHKIGTELLEVRACCGGTADFDVDLCRYFGYCTTNGIKVLSRENGKLVEIETRNCTTCETRTLDDSSQQFDHP